LPKGMGPHGRIPGKPDLRKINPATLKRLFSYMAGYKKQLILVVICIVISSLTLAISALFLRTLIDDHITPLLLEAEPDFSGLFRVIIIMGIIYTSGALATLFYNWLMVDIAQGVLKKIRDEMFSHMQSLPIRFFDSRSHGDVMSYYTNDADTLRQMLTMSLPQTFAALVTMTSVLLAMLYLSFWLTLLVLGFTYLALRIVGFIASKSGSYFIKQQQSLGEVNGYVEEIISGLKVVKVFNHEEVAKEDFDEKNDILAAHSTEAHKFANILMPITHNLGYILYVLVAIVGGSLAISGVTNISLAGAGLLTLGMIASFLQLSRSFINPLAQVTMQLNSVVMALAGAERIFKLMDEQGEVDDGHVSLVNVKNENGTLVETEERTEHWAWKNYNNDGSQRYTELHGDVRFHEVDFGYDENELVLKNITLYAEPGQKLALVGATGAGKTTITNLLTRFYDIADGKIRYDGININKIKKSDLRRSLGMVLQDVHLFSGTVMDNIRYGRLDATDEECIGAGKMANADSFIKMLPHGYQTELTGDGSSLSQGQRQLISIARAAVADPPVMILDEATSSIDTRTEAIVQEGMDKLMHGRTVFVIAHRLSTIQNSDVIMVIEDGQIIERGNHEKLISEKGRYYQLYTGAFELE
jgi:ATP-binding cassette, subfamily B, multidrug efflux pump